jgi:hypothetical protein
MNNKRKMKKIYMCFVGRSMARAEKALGICFGEDAVVTIVAVGGVSVPWAE